MEHSGCLKLLVLSSCSSLREVRRNNTTTPESLQTHQNQQGNKVEGRFVVGDLHEQTWSEGHFPFCREACATQQTSGSTSRHGECFKYFPQKSFWWDNFALCATIRAIFPDFIKPHDAGNCWLLLISDPDSCFGKQVELSFSVSSFQTKTFLLVAPTLKTRQQLLNGIFVKRGTDSRLPEN